jgi:hypothetical protein
LPESYAAHVSAPATPTGHVRMSDGKETIDIPEGDVADAMKAGFKRAGK